MNTREVFKAKALPSFFKHCCLDAQRGGRNSYKWAAYELARNLSRFQPDGLGDGQWEAAILELEKATGITNPDGSTPRLVADRELNCNATMEWFDRHLPHAMQLIPRKSRDAFLAGIRQAIQDEIIDLEY